MRMRIVRDYLFKKGKRFILDCFPFLGFDIPWIHLINHLQSSHIGENVKTYSPYNISNSTIGDFSYVAQNSIISNTTIGKYCSIGPNFLCGWGIHPTNGISTSPMFYSTRKQNGVSLVMKDKVIERKHISIGNDVFIGANVTILDGISIGDGAVIGAGSVVSKDIPPYAIAAGTPIKIIRRRFPDETIESMLRIRWWDMDIDKLADVEKMFFNIDDFVKKYDTNQ